jgi:hypothetical protein
MRCAFRLRSWSSPQLKNARMWLLLESDRAETPSEARGLQVHADPLFRLQHGRSISIRSW